MMNKTCKLAVHGALVVAAMGAADAFCPSAADSEIIESIKRIAGEGSESNG